MMMQPTSISINSSSSPAFRKGAPSLRQAETSSAYFGRAFAQEKGTFGTWAFGVPGNKGKTVFSSSQKPNLQNGVSTPILATVGGFALLVLGILATRHFKAPASKTPHTPGKTPTGQGTPVQPGGPKTLDLATALGQLQTAPAVTPEALKVVTDEIKALQQAGKQSEPQYTTMMDAIKNHTDTNILGQALTLLEDTTPPSFISDLLKNATHRQKTIEHAHRYLQKLGSSYDNHIIEALGFATSTNDVRNILQGINFNQADTATERDAILQHIWKHANPDLPVTALDVLVSGTSNAPSSPLPLLTTALTELPPALHPEVAKRINLINNEPERNQLFETLLDSNDSSVVAQTLEHLDPREPATHPLWAAANSRQSTARHPLMLQAALDLRDISPQEQQLQREVDVIQNATYRSLPFVGTGEERKQAAIHALINQKLTIGSVPEKAAALERLDLLPEDQRLGALETAFARAANKDQEYSIRKRILDTLPTIAINRISASDPSAASFKLTDRTFSQIIQNALGDNLPQVRHHALEIAYSHDASPLTKTLAEEIATRETDYSVKSRANQYFPPPSP